MHQIAEIWRYGSVVLLPSSAAIALRHLEEDLRSGDAAVKDGIQREVSLREHKPEPSEKGSGPA